MNAFHQVADHLVASHADALAVSGDHALAILVEPRKPGDQPRLIILDLDLGIYAEDQRAHCTGILKNRRLSLILSLTGHGSEKQYQGHNQKNGFDCSLLHVIVSFLLVVLIEYASMKGKPGSPLLFF